jgi:hypothetical protein
MTPFIVIGNPENRRVTMFQAALAAQGLAAATVIAWRDLVAEGAAARVLGELPAGPAILRIDSAGEDEDIERALILRGEAPARAEGYAAAVDARRLEAIPRELGRILCPRQQHLGFIEVLREIEAAVHPAWRVTQSVPAIRDLFDKRVTSARWQAMGIPVPEFLTGVRDPEELRVQMRAQGWSSVFVKVASSSSASCLAIFTIDARGEHAITTVEDTGKARYNTRKLQRLTTARAIDRLLGFLLSEGSQIECAIPKAGLGEGYFDLRVLTIDGEPAFIVVRSAPHPITNLHLGGQRGDLEDLKARVPAASWEAAMASCVRVQQASGAFHVGIDLMFEPGLRAHRVIEGNAFGDLLPNLVKDGLDVYGWQIARLLRA